MDRDLYQLVDDARGIRVLNIGKGVTKLEVVTDESCARSTASAAASTRTSQHCVATRATGCPA